MPHFWFLGTIVEPGRWDMLCEIFWNLSFCEPSWEVIEEVVYVDVDVDVDVNGTAKDDLGDMVMILMVLLMMLITQPLNVRMAKSSVSSEALVRVELEQGLHL